MTKNQNRIILLIVGLILGVLCTLGVYRFKHFMDNFLYIEYANSSEKLRKKIQSSGIELPDKAYNIDFFHISTVDDSSWLAFSAGEKQIQKFIHELPFSKYDEKTQAEPTPYVPSDRAGNKMDWWPEKTDNFKIYYRQFCWIGYDKANSRIYIHYYTH